MARGYENLRKKKASGGRVKPSRGRRAYEKDSYAAETVLGDALLVQKRVRGGGLKQVLRRVDYANVADPSKKTVTKVKILKVVGNPANRDYERREIVTKGAVIETELGKAKVTSRPSQHGVVNALLIR